MQKIKRVAKQVEALNTGDFEEFKIGQSYSDSSYKFLQNVYANCDVQKSKSVSIGLAMSEKLSVIMVFVEFMAVDLRGTIQAFVKDEFVPVYKEKIEKVFGKDSCHVLKSTQIGWNESIIGA